MQSFPSNPGREFVTFQSPATGCGSDESEPVGECGVRNVLAYATCEGDGGEVQL